MSDSLVLAIFLLSTMSMAGVVHVVWLRYAQSPLLLRPIDCGVQYRGRRLFGDNKRLRGFIALPLAAATAFALVGDLRELFPATLANSLWRLSVWQYAGVGLAAGLGFMLAELPNSFIKRQLGVPPGALPSSGPARFVSLLVDRIDSALGVLIAVSLLVPVPAMTWFWVLLIGPGLHALFSTLLFRFGIKERAL